MPIRAEVEGLGVLEFPDGTDPAVIRQTVTAQLKQQSLQSRQSALYKGGNMPPERNFTSSALHGAIDSGEAVGQMVGHAATAMGLPPGSDYPFVASPDVVKASAAKAREGVNSRFGQPNAGGMDLVRTLSSGALAVPLQGPVGTAGTMVGRGLQAARAGAVQGAMQPVEDSGNALEFLGKKGLQGGAGAAIGGVMNPALEMGASGVQNIANKVLSRANGAIKDTSDQAAVAFAREALEKQGVAFDSLQKSVQQSILSDVKNALKKYGGVNSAALARQSDFKALGVDPLEPWVTRDPVQWGQYKNLEMAKDAGEPLIRARAELDAKLTQRLQGLAGNTGDAYESGQIVGKGFAASHARVKDRVTSLYDQFRATAPNVSADPKRLTDTILDSVEKDALGDFLGPLRNLVNDFATGKRPTTPDSLYRAQQVANAIVRKGGPEGMAARRVAEGIDNELEQMARDMSAVGPEMGQAATLLKQARAAHRQIKHAEESMPALKAVAEGTFAPEDFFNKYVLGGDVREVAKMWANSDSEMRGAVRSQIVDHLKKAAVGGSGEGPFRQGNFTQAISAPGMRQKIEIVIGKAGIEEVQRIARAAESAIRTPAGARYNTSGSAMEMMNLLRRSGGIPGVGPMITEPLHKAGQQMQAGGLMNPGASAIGQGLLDPFYEEILRRSRQGAGLLSPFAAGGSVGEFSR
jgi:hypothetical protein